MKKHITRVLTVLASLFAAFVLTGTPVLAAGTAEEPKQLSQEELQYVQVGQQMVTALANDYEQGTDLLVSYFGIDEKVAERAYESWRTAHDQFGTLQGYDESTSSFTYDQKNLRGTIVVGMIGDNNRKGTVTIDLNENGVADIMVSVEDTKAEALQKAGLNTLLGMGMAFGVLILIAVIIRLVFPQIYKLSQNLEAKKNGEKKAPAPAPAPAAPAVVEEEEVTDDGELIAVIAAAIAASEGSTSTDGFVVRSIRRRR